MVTGLPQDQVDGYNKIRDQFRYVCTREGDTYTISFVAPGMPGIDESFQLGVEHEHKDITGRTIKVKCPPIFPKKVLVH